MKHNEVLVNDISAILLPNDLAQKVLFNNVNTSYKIFEEEKSKPDAFLSPFAGTKSTYFTGRYHLVLVCYFTEYEVGVGDDDYHGYEISWELISENDKYVVFEGWGEGEAWRFSNKRIAITRNLFLIALRNMNKHYPEMYSSAKLSKTIGLEKGSQTISWHD